MLSNIYAIAIWEEKEESEAEEIFENITVKNFSKIRKGIKPPIQEVHRT